MNTATPRSDNLAALQLLDEKYEKGDIIQVAAKKGSLDYAIATE